MFFKQRHVKGRLFKPDKLQCFFSKSMTKSSLSTIGSIIGGKDHATVLHACKTVNNLKDTDKRFKSQIEDIERRLKI